MPPGRSKGGEAAHRRHGIGHVEEQEAGEDEIEGRARHGLAARQVGGDEVELRAFVAPEPGQHLRAEAGVDVEAGDVSPAADEPADQAHHLARAAARIEAAHAGRDAGGGQHAVRRRLPEPRLPPQAIVLGLGSTEDVAVLRLGHVRSPGREGDYSSRAAGRRGMRQCLCDRAGSTVPPGPRARAAAARPPGRPLRALPAGVPLPFPRAAATRRTSAISCKGVTCSLAGDHLFGAASPSDASPSTRPPAVSMKATISGMPTPSRTWANWNGRSPRMRRESRSMMSSDAPM